MAARFMVPFAIVAALNPLTSAALAGDVVPAACTTGTFETMPAAVIEPCTIEIAKQSLSPDVRATAFYLRARGYHRTGRLSQAAQDYDVAIKLAPNRSEFYVHRANVEYRQGQFRKSYSDLTQSLTLDPHNAIAFRALGDTYSDAGQLDKAVDYYGQALAIDPAEPYSLMNRSDLLQRMNRFDEALRDADALVAIPPAVINRLGYVNSRSELEDFHVVALTHRAELYVQLGKHVEAEKDYDAAVAAKWSPEALVPRGEYRFAQPGQMDGALNDLNEAVRLNPDDHRAEFDLGLALREVKRFDAALTAFSKAAAKSPYPGQALLMRAHTYRDLGRTDEAIVDLEEAIKIDPSVRESTHLAFVGAGYLIDAAGDQASSAAQHAAVRACMLDPTCN